VTRRIDFRNGQDITLTYDHENRLTSISGGASATYVYDGDGNLVKRNADALIGTYYEYQSGGASKKYYYLGTTRVAVREADGTLSYLLADHLGSSNVTANAAGQRVTELRYYPYGLERYDAGAQKTEYRYTGQRIEDAADLYFYRSRWRGCGRSVLLQEPLV